MPGYVLPRCGILFLLAFTRASSALTVFSNDPTESCVIMGDPDLYGIGVRLSYYLSFSAAVLASSCGLFDELSNIRRGIIIITSAVLIETIISSTKGSFSILEWYIVSLETVGLAWPCFWPSVTGKEQSTGGGSAADDDRELWESTKADAILYGLFSVIQGVNQCLAPYIYFTRLNQGYQEGCSVTTFFFARFNIYAPPWIVFTKFSAIAGILGALSYFVYCGSVLFHAFLAFLARREKSEPEEEDDNSSSKEWAWTGGIGIAVLMIAYGIPSAYFAERVIRDNKINMNGASLGSSSQLIAFLVGLFNLVAVLSKCIWKCILSLHSGETIHLSKHDLAADNSIRDEIEIEIEIQIEKDVRS